MQRMLSIGRQPEVAQIAWLSRLTWSPTDGRDPDSSSTDSDERPAPAAYIKEGPLPISRRLAVGSSGWLCFLSLPSVNK